MRATMKRAVAAVVLASSCALSSGSPEMILTTRSCEALVGHYENKDPRFRISLHLASDGTFTRRFEDFQAEFERGASALVRRGTGKVDGSMVALTEDEGKTSRRSSYRMVIAPGGFALAPAEAKLDLLENRLEILTYLFEMPNPEIGTTRSAAKR